MKIASLCHDLLKSRVNQNVEKNLKLIKEENYLKAFWQEVQNLI